MKLKDIEFIRLLPAFMRADPINIGLAKGIDKVIKMFAGAGEHFSIWTAIDKLTEPELDELAWELNITWYEKSAPVEVKRKIIKGSDEVKDNLGTGFAVEKVISDYFGIGYIEEWFEYNGEPGHFKVISSNPSITQGNLNKFLRVLEKVKRKSAHLEGIYIGLTGRSELRMGAGARETEFVTVRPKKNEIKTWKAELNTGLAVHEFEICKVRPR